MNKNNFFGGEIEQIWNLCSYIELLRKKIEIQQYTVYKNKKKIKINCNIYIHVQCAEYIRFTVWKLFESHFRMCVCVYVFDCAPFYTSKQITSTVYQNYGN